MKTETIQEIFFRQIKQKIPAHLSLADEIATLLNISPDSAYRRIRSEKPLTIDEMQLLAARYAISLDAFMNIESENYTFSGSLVNSTSFRLEDYLRQTVKHLTMIDQAKHKSLYVMNKDIPLFHLFTFPELACFKCFFWSRYNLNYSNFSKGQFMIGDFMSMYDTYGAQICELYLKIPSTEVWNIDCINTTIRQIDYFRIANVFKSRADIISIYESLEKLINHLENQTETGFKFPYKKPAASKGVKYAVFMNEYVLGDNTTVVEMDETRIVFLNHSVMNYLYTTNKKLVDYIFDSIQVVLKKSTLISDVGEKDRQLFFETMRERIYEKKKLVK